MREIKTWIVKSASWPSWIFFRRFSLRFRACYLYKDWFVQNFWQLMCPYHFIYMEPMFIDEVDKENNNLHMFLGRSFKTSDF